MALQSPGVEVTVIDESFYTPAEPGTTPLIVVATAQDKTNGVGTGTALGTTQANAGKAFKITSQRELTETFGVPFFEKTASASPVHGSERNEYGLLAAYSLLGVSNAAFIVRADIDLSELAAETDAPGANPTNGQWWIDTQATTWGIQEWNGAAATVAGGQKFEYYVPIVLTDADFPSKIGGNAPKASVGQIGEYAVVFRTVEGDNSFGAAEEYARIYYKSAGNGGIAGGGTAVDAGEWVHVGSNKWSASWPVVSGTAVNGTVSYNFFVNNSLITGTGTTATIAAAINAANIQGVTARVISTRLNIYSDGTSSADGSAGDSSAADGRVLLENGTSDLSALGITAGLYLSPRLAQQPHTSVPSFKRSENTDTVAGAATGSVWIKTTEPNNGARWRAKRWSSATQSWVSFEAPIYNTTTAALFFLDRSGGGAGIPEDALFTQANATEASGFDTTPATATFRLWYRNIGVGAATSITSNIVKNGTVASGAKTFVMRESLKTTLALGATKSISFTAVGTNQDAELIAAAINAAGFVNIVASVTEVSATSNRLVISHTLGGDFRLADTQGTAIDSIFTAFNLNTLAGTENFYQAESAVGGVAPTQTFVVTTVANPGTPPPANIFRIDGVNRPVLNLVRGGVYTFDQSAASNANHPIAFRLADGVTSFTTGVVTTGTAGQAGANTVFTVPNDAPNGLVYYCITHGNGMGNTITVLAAGTTAANTSDYLASGWKPLAGIEPRFSASPNAPLNEPQDGQLWYNPNFSEVDIMVHNGNTFVGYRHATAPYFEAATATLRVGYLPIVSASNPYRQSVTQDGDLWISTADLENFPTIYRYNVNLSDIGDLSQRWQLLDKADQTTEEGVLFADARWNTSGTSKIASTIEDLITNNFLDPDAPDPALFPKGMLLWNLRRSGGNVKQYQNNYIDTTTDNPRTGTATMAGSAFQSGESMETYETDRWTTASGNNEDGSGSFGRKAQRKVVTQRLKSVVDTSQEIRDEERRNFNIIAAPGYPELLSNLVNLNIVRGVTAFVVGDTPLRLASDATSLTTWGTNANLVTDNGDDGIVTFDEYLAVYYPNGITTDLSGSPAVVPASHMMLKTITLSDNVSFPWFAPAGTRRGGITNATAVGFIDPATGEFQTVALNEGQRDTLYDLKVNPIPFFNGIGLIANGQKTRARNASALDRINVARLVVYLRSQLNKLARPYIFEPNDKITRDEIKQAVESLLLELVGLRALYDFAVVCDESNNTPSRIDRNELYVDIAIEPVKAIEFIYIPLRVQNTGEI